MFLPGRRATLHLRTYRPDAIAIQRLHPDLGANLPRPALKHKLLAAGYRKPGGVYATLTRHRKGVLQRAQNRRGAKAENPPQLPDAP